MTSAVSRNEADTLTDSLTLLHTLCGKCGNVVQNYTQILGEQWNVPDVDYDVAKLVKSCSFLLSIFLRPEEINAARRLGFATLYV